MDNLQIKYVPLSLLRHPDKNPRRWTDEATKQLKESIKRFGCVDPLIVNSAPERKGIIIGGNFRAKVLEEMKTETVPVVWINIPDPKKEQELILRLNKNTGEFYLDLLAEFAPEVLQDVGFSSEELDDIFALDPTPEEFNINDELDKLNIKNITVQKGDIYEIDGSRLMCGDSTTESDMLTLMKNTMADMVMSDPPYVLDYLRGKTKNGKPTEGFGLKKNRKYLETDVLPPDFTEKWMANVAKVQKPDFSIIVFENPKNLRTIWNELEKHWKYRNTITWHIPNRIQGYAAKNKFFNKTDIALVGSSEKKTTNFEPEGEELFQTEYENALYATSGNSHFEGYKKGKKICPTDFIEHIAADEKSSGQSIIFGTKPLELLIPYIKVLTKRDDLVLEPFGGSGSTLIASLKLGRKCRIMEKVPTYAQVIIARWEKFTGKKAIKIN